MTDEFTVTKNIAVTKRLLFKEIFFITYILSKRDPSKPSEFLHSRVRTCKYLGTYFRVSTYNKAFGRTLELCGI